MHQSIKNITASSERVATHSRPLALSIEIQNFQSYRQPAFIPLSNLTIVCGPNSAGKSVILDAIELIRSVAKNLEDGHAPFERWLAHSGDDDTDVFSGGLTSLSVTFTPGFESRTSWIIENKLMNNNQRFGDFEDWGKNEFAIHRLFYSYDYDLAGELYEEYRQEDGTIVLSGDDLVLSALRDKCHRQRNLYFKFLGDQSGLMAVEIGIDGVQLMTLSKDMEPGFEFNVDHPLLIDNSDNDDAEALKELGDVWREFGRPIDGKEGFRTIGSDNGGYWTFDFSNMIYTTAPLWGDKDRELITQASAIFGVFGELVLKSLELNSIPGLRFTPVNPVAIEAFTKSARNASRDSIWSNVAKDLARESLSSSIDANVTDFTLEKINQALSGSSNPNMSLDLGYKLKIIPNLSMTAPDLLSLIRLDNEKDKFESIYKYLQSVSFQVEDQDGRELDLEDVGTGVSQLIPVLWSAVSTSLAGIVHIQQPELHLHPALQMRLADQFLLNREGKELTWIIETHSEHFILRILKRIRQTAKLGDVSPIQIRPSNVVILYIWKDPKYGSRVAHMKITSDGDFEDRWPHGFFEERADEWLD